MLLLVEDHVDFPYADGALDYSCYYEDDLLEVDNETADADYGYSVVEVNRNLARATLVIGSFSKTTSKQRKVQDLL